MNNIHKLILLSFFTVLCVSCQKDDISITPIDRSSGVTMQTIEINEDIDSDQTWSTGNVYILKDLISIENGATLTIEPGVLVKADVGPTGLVITKGAKINAQGQASQPIIFTSLTDEMEVGDVTSPNLSSSDVALWSGIFMLGCAPVSTMVDPSNFPLLPADPSFLYGGNDSEDYSGVLNYVSIRHAGYEVVQYETPSSLNLGGVGNKTSITNIELWGNEDDAIVIDGGSVNLENIVSVHYKDDGIDCDRGWSGTIDNYIGVGAPESDVALELDGGEGTTNPSFTIRNTSFKGGLSEANYIEFRSRVNCKIENTYFFDFGPTATVSLDRDVDADNWINELIDVSNIEINTSHLTSGNTSIATIFVDEGSNGNDAFVLRAPDATIVNTPTVGANKTVFASWTAADWEGDLDDF